MGRISFCCVGRRRSPNRITEFVDLVVPLVDLAGAAPRRLPARIRWRRALAIGAGLA